MTYCCCRVVDVVVIIVVFVAVYIVHRIKSPQRLNSLHSQLGALFSVFVRFHQYACLQFIWLSSCYSFRKFCARYKLCVSLWWACLSKIKWYAHHSVGIRLQFTCANEWYNRYSFRAKWVSQNDWADNFRIADFKVYFRWLQCSILAQWPMLL